MKETMYRIAVPEPGRVTGSRWWCAKRDPLDVSDWTPERNGGELFPAKFAWAWVQVLGVVHDVVIVERVEVVRG